MPVDLVLVRHGESEGNEAVRRARAGDDSMLQALRGVHSSFWGLTDAGIEQARRSGEWLRAEFPGGFDRYYTSEYRRAMQTAAHLGLPDAEWILHPDLRERSWGDLDRLTPAEREQQFAASLAEKAAAPFYWRPPNGESMAEVCARLIAILRTVRHECPHGQVILVCHGESIGAFRAKLEAMSQLEWQAWSTDPDEKIANGEIVHYTRRDPHTGVASDHLDWRRSVVPGDDARSKPWERIERRRYDATGLLEVAAEVSHAPHGPRRR